jgi:hypothetical protein
MYVHKLSFLRIGSLDIIDVVYYLSYSSTLTVLRPVTKFQISMDFDVDYLCSNQTLENKGAEDIWSIQGYAEGLVYVVSSS